MSIGQHRAMKKRASLFSPEAEAELLGIYDWIADASSAKVAFGYVTRIEEFCQRLSIGSLRGQARMISDQGFASSVSSAVWQSRSSTMPTKS